MFEPEFGWFMIYDDVWRLISRVRPLVCWEFLIREDAPTKRWYLYDIAQKTLDMFDGCLFVRFFCLLFEGQETRSSRLLDTPCVMTANLLWMAIPDSNWWIMTQSLLAHWEPRMARHICISLVHIPGGAVPLIDGVLGFGGFWRSYTIDIPSYDGYPPVN
jgi:hypothetical protein